MQALAICVTALYVVQACTLHTMNNIQCAYSVHTTRTMQARGTTRLTTRRTDCGVAKAWYPVVSVLGGGYHRVPRRTTPVPRVGTAWVRRGYGVAACSARQTTCDRRSLRFNRHHTGKYLHGTECSIRTLFPLKTLCGAICSERSATFRSISSHSVVLAVTSFLPQATATSFCHKLLQQASDHIQPDSFSCRGVTAQEETNRRKATDNMQQTTV
jgi:hypothetical protein